MNPYGIDDGVYAMLKPLLDAGFAVSFARIRGESNAGIIVPCISMKELCEVVARMNVSQAKAIHSMAQQQQLSEKQLDEVFEWTQDLADSLADQYESGRADSFVRMFRGEKPEEREGS